MRRDALEPIARRADAGVVVDPAGARAGGGEDAVGTRERRARERGVVRRPLRAGDIVLGAVHEEEHRALCGIQLRHRRIDDAGDGAHGGGEDGLHACGLDAVDHVVLLEHERGGDDHRADLVERERAHPERVVAAQDDQDLVALADALRQEVVGRLVGEAREIGEGEVVLLALGVAPEHGEALGLRGADLVDDVVGEVEVCGDVDAEAGEIAGGVEGLGAVASVYVEHLSVLLIAGVRGNVRQVRVLGTAGCGRLRLTLRGRRLHRRRRRGGHRVRRDMSLCGPPSLLPDAGPSRLRCEQLYHTRT